jgi:hypothetical protein
VYDVVGVVVPVADVHLPKVVLGEVGRHAVPVGIGRRFVVH